MQLFCVGLQTAKFAVFLTTCEVAVSCPVWNAVCSIPIASCVDKNDKTLISCQRPTRATRTWTSETTTEQGVVSVQAEKQLQPASLNLLSLLLLWLAATVR